MKKGFSQLSLKILYIYIYYENSTFYKLEDCFVLKRKKERVSKRSFPNRVLEPVGEPPNESFLIFSRIKIVLQSVSCSPLTLSLKC